VKKIALIGASGNVGRQLVELMIQRQVIDLRQVSLFASPKSHGQILRFSGFDFTVCDVNQCVFSEDMLAIFTTESDISKQYIPTALSAGATVIDASSAYRLDPNVPLIVPPVNGHLITHSHRLFAHANCLASPMSLVLTPLHQYATITRVNVSTYQSTSGAGKAAMQALYEETKDYYAAQPVSAKHFPRPIAFNVIPQVSDILEDGFSYEEYKIIQEVQKIVSPSIQIVATSVRVPVMIGHGMSLSIEFEQPVDIDEVKALLSRSPGVTLSENHYTTPLEVQGRDDVFVGRIRRDPSVASGVLAWLVSDNLRRGAALDAIEAAEIIMSMAYTR